jgi:hypothetical protein
MRWCPCRRVNDLIPDPENPVSYCSFTPPEKFETRDVKWSPDGKGFILFDKDQFCCAFEVEDEESGVT